MVPTLDGGARFVACLAALARQRPAPAGLVVIDSGSRDGTVAAARAAGAHVIEIPPAEFDHGATRNLGAAALPGVDVLVFLVQDAVPQGEDCLAALAAAALGPGVAAATARQVPPAEAGPLTASSVCAGLFGGAEPRAVGPFTPVQRDGMAPEEWRGQLLLDDVCCALRAPLFRAVGGYRRTSHGEDALMAFDLLCGGWALAFEPAAVVEHGHAYDARTVVPRYRADARFFREAFGFRARPDLLSVLKGYNAELSRDRRFLSAHGEWLGGRPLSAVLSGARALRWAQVMAQRDGSRGALGRLPVPRPVPAPGALSGASPGALPPALDGTLPGALLPDATPGTRAPRAATGAGKDAAQNPTVATTGASKEPARETGGPAAGGPSASRPAAAGRLSTPRGKPRAPGKGGR
ncbi:MAG TPA: glycosyltransferase [Planctomycetota bacterium]|nr:glycosyltransferase [Planctomycetota bacterium]